MFPFEPDNIVDFSKDFYKQYPEAKAIFHPTPSDTMWAYVLLYHENSPFKNLSLKRKLQEVERVATRKIKYEGYEEAEKLFEEGSTDANKKALTRWRKKLDERDDYMESLSYENPDDIPVIEKFLGNSKSVWDAYWQAEKQLKKEEGSLVSGDQQESATEKGFI